MQVELRVTGLPNDALGAARQFYDEWLGPAEELLASECTSLSIILPDAPYDHDDWRRAAARDLARAHAPKRVNVVAGAEGESLSGTLDYLAGAPGVTGQYLKTA